MRAINNIAYYRKEVGISRKSLGDLVGVDRTIIWRYENNKCNPRDSIKVKIAKALDRTVEEIFFSPCVALNATSKPTGTG